MNLGIGMVHQEFMLLPGFTITENIKLNREITTENPISKIVGRSLETLDEEAMANDARAALQKLNLTVDESLPIAGLPVGYMQFVEIAREIDKKNVRFLVFDEPTAVLTEGEAKRLLDVMKRLSAEGMEFSLLRTGSMKYWRSATLSPFYAMGRSFTDWRRTKQTWSSWPN